MCEGRAYLAERVSVKTLAARPFIQICIRFLHFPSVSPGFGDAALNKTFKNSGFSVFIFHCALVYCSCGIDVTLPLRRWEAIGGF